MGGIRNSAVSYLLSSSHTFQDLVIDFVGGAVLQCARAVPNHIPPWLDLITREVCGYRYAIRDALLRARLLRLLHLEAPMG